MSNTYGSKVHFFAVPDIMKILAARYLKRGNYSREETIRGNTVYELEYGIRTANCSPWDHCVMMPSLDHQKSKFSLIFGNLSVVGY